MTKRIGNTVFIEAQDYQSCELCGKSDECRPAGPKGENVCWECANKDKAAMKRYNDRLFQGGLTQ